MNNYCAAKPRRLRVTIPIAQVTSTGLAAPNPQPAGQAFLYIPSSRLAVSLRICQQVAKGTLQTYDPGGTGRGLCNWQITPCAPTAAFEPNSNAPVTAMPLSPVFVDSDGTASRRNLPDVWEYQGPTGLFLLQYNLNVVTGPSAGQYEQTIIADATFEATDDIDDKQLNDLFSRCDLRADGGPITMASFGVA